MRALLAPLCLACVNALAVEPAPTPAPPPEFAVVRMEAGTWTADIEFFDPATGKVTGTARGVMECRVIGNGQWVLDDFRVHGTPYQGLGTWGWDPTKNKFIGSWVDVNQTFLRIDEGTWDAATQTLDWRTRMPNGDSMLDWKFLVRFDGDKRSFESFYLSPKDGTPRRTIKIVFTRQTHG